MRSGCWGQKRCTNRGSTPVVLIHKNEEALGGGLHKPAQALIHRGVPVPDLLQNHAHDDHIVHCSMLQKVDLHN